MNRTWADAAVDIATAIIATMGPIGVGAILVIATIGAALWLLDRRGVMRPQGGAHNAAPCKNIDDIKLLLAEHHGANEAHHSVTHGRLSKIEEKLR